MITSWVASIRRETLATLSFTGLIPISISHSIRQTFHAMTREYPLHHQWDGSAEALRSVCFETESVVAVCNNNRFRCRIYEIQVAHYFAYRSDHLTGKAMPDVADILTCGCVCEKILRNPATVQFFIWL